MATYSKQCTAVGSFGYASYFKLYVELTETDVSTSGNTSKVKYKVYCESSGSGSISAKHLKYFKLNGTEIINETVSVNVESPNAYISIASGTTSAISHSSDGSKSISFSAKIEGATYGVSASLSGTFDLTTIPRYATLSHSLNSKTINSIKINWTSDSTCNQVQYKLGSSGSWVTASSSSAKSGTYTISSLQPNTTYSIYTKVRRSDSSLYTESSALSVTTYDIAKISSASNFEHGSNASITITNPASISSLSLVMKINDTQILTRTVVVGSNSIVFTDTELDSIYKLYETNNSLTVTYTLTGSGYTNSKTCTVTLTGNQKTGHINISEVWKRGKVWININGTWKKAVMWININGAWRRSS